MNIKYLSSGKVRNIYSVGKEYLLLVASDRVSAFDVVLPQPIPEKGKILTDVSNFWMDKTEHIIKNHLVKDFPMEDISYAFPDKQDILERSVLVKKLRPFPVEFVVRGYISGSAWTEYKETGSIQGYFTIPRGLQESEELPSVMFTPTTKAPLGKHDIPLNFHEYIELMNSFTEINPIDVMDLAIELYKFAAKYAHERGIIIADTKLELGLDEDNTLYLIDEAFTPDSSRFWPLKTFAPGGPQFSLDKQYIRDYLNSIEWDKNSPPPDLPEDVIANTTNKYREIRDILIGS